MHLYKTRGLRCLEITQEEREVRHHSRQEEDIENGVIQMMEERKYGGYHVHERNNSCLCFGDYGCRHTRSGSPSTCECDC